MNIQKNEVTDLIAGQIDQLRAELDSLVGVVLEKPFIVDCADLPLSFDVSESGQVTNPTTAESPGRATRFTRVDAEAVAATVNNGNGTKGKSIHVRVAIQNALTKSRDLFDKLAPVGDWFVNEYTCSKCGHPWEDQWDSACADECPACGCDMTPHTSTAVERDERSSGEARAS